MSKGKKRAIPGLPISSSGPMTEDDLAGQLVKRWSELLRGEAENASTETCAECGKSVAPGSGRFANRVPILDDKEDRVDAGWPHPKGKFICDECNIKIYTEVEEEPGACDTN